MDLAKFAGKGRQIVLETNGYEKDGNPTRAYWGAPALTTASAKEAPLAIVYLVDTLRADHTQPYGYERDTTPELLKFAQDGVVFEQAIAQASWTKPAVASVLTSLLPGHHRAVQLRDPLDADLLTLPEMLGSKGYATGAAIANSVIYGAGGQFEQGFDHFAGLHGAEDRPSKLVEAAGVVDEALRFLDRRRGFPTFLYVHTMDPHVPYAPPAPFDTKYEPHATPDHPGVDPRSDYKEPIDRERMIARYDGDIAYGDREFGRFVRELKARGLYDRALIVFIADHGEEFLDHGKWLHGKSVFDELVHVPLIVKFPGGQDAGRRVKAQVRGGRRAADGPAGAVAARARAAHDHRPAAAARDRGRRPGAPRAVRDQPPRLRRARHAHGARQVRPALQPGGGRAVLRPPEGPEGAARASSSRAASASAC